MTEQLVAGATIFKKKKGAVEWLVLKTDAKTPGVLPTALVRRGESSVGAMLRTLREERGMAVEVLEESGRILTASTRDGSKVAEKVIYYLIEELGSSERGRIPREEKWGQHAKVVKYLGSEREKKMLKLAKDVLKELARNKDASRRRMN